MGTTTTSVMQFDAEASQAVSELQRLAAAQRDLGRQMRETAEVAMKGDQAQSQRLNVLAQQFVRNERAIARNRAALRNLAVESNSTGRSMGRFSSVIGHLSFAMDDFLTVLQMPGMGLIPALRSASNNVSMLLFGVNPLLAIVPSLGTAMLTLATNTWNAANAKKEMANAADQAIGKLREELEVMQSLGREQEKQEELDHQKQLQGITKEQLDLRGRRQQIFDDLREALASGIWDLTGAETNEQILAIMREASPNLAYGLTGGTFAEALSQLEREELELGQKRNLVEQTRAERIRLRERQEAEQKRMTQVRHRLQPLLGPLSNLAATSLAEGVAPDDVMATMMGLIGNRFSTEEQEVLRDELQDVLHNASGSAFNMRMKPPKVLDPRRQRIDALTLQLEALELELQESLIGKPDRQAQGIRRRFDRRHGREIDEMQAERARLQFELAKDANKGIEEKQETSNEILLRIEKILESGGFVPPPVKGGRDVPRNP